MSFGSSEWVWVCMCQCEIGSQWFEWNYGASQQLARFLARTCRVLTNQRKWMRKSERHQKRKRDDECKPAKWRCYARYDSCALCENWKRSLGIQSAYFHIVWSRRWVFFAWIYAFCQFVDANDKHSRMKNFFYLSLSLFLEWMSVWFLVLSMQNTAAAVAFVFNFNERTHKKWKIIKFQNGPTFK